MWVCLTNEIKCAQANLYTIRERWLFIKVYRFVCSHFNSKLNTQIYGHHCNSFLLMRTDKITKDQSTSPLMKKMVQFRRIDSVLTFEEFKYMPKNKELHNHFCSIVQWLSVVWGQIFLYFHLCTIKAKVNTFTHIYPHTLVQNFSLSKQRLLIVLGFTFKLCRLLLNCNIFYLGKIVFL